MDYVNNILLFKMVVNNIKLKNKLQEIEEFKEQIRKSKYQTYQIEDDHGNLVGTTYIKEKLDYGFHIFFIHEPNDKNNLSGKNGIISEMYYDLRNKKYYIKRNLKDVNFSVRNVDSIFPASRNQRQEIFTLLSTINNKGLYEKAYLYLGSMGNEKSEMYGRFFHRLITEHSYFELLYKSGISVTSKIKIANKNGSTPIDILGINKTQWKMVTKYNISTNYFTDYNYKNNSISNENDMQAINYLSYIKMLENEFGIDKIIDFYNNEFDSIYNKDSSISRCALKIAKNYNLPIKKLLRYVYFECDVSQGLSSFTAIEQYNDYIRMTTEMGYERFERYPKYLRTAHDIASRNYKIKLNEIELIEWQERYEENKQYQYTYGGYKIFPPSKPEDLIREGNILGHCVGSYINKVKKGLSVILFLRDKNDIDHPLVTIEVKNKIIIQTKGKMNESPRPEEKKIIKAFAEKFDLVI